MTYQRSPRDILAELSASVKRDLSDLQIDYLGTESQVLRIELRDRDVLGDRDETLVTNLIANVVIKHPMGNKQWLFSHSDSTTDTSTSDAINIWEILPITMKIKYNADYTTEPVNIQKGDMIVEILKDENNNNLPVIYQVTKLLGGFEGKYLYQKEYDLTIYRGEIPHDIQNAINLFISGELMTTTVSSNVTNQILITQFKAGTQLLKNRAVCIDSNQLIQYADSENVNYAYNVLGINISNIDLNGTPQICNFGEMTSSVWNWTIGLPIYVGADGILTQTKPTVGFILEIAQPITTTSILVNMKTVVLV